MEALEAAIRSHDDKDLMFSRYRDSSKLSISLLPTHTNNTSLVSEDGNKKVSKGSAAALSKSPSSVLQASKVAELRIQLQDRKREIVQLKELVCKQKEEIESLSLYKSTCTAQKIHLQETVSKLQGKLDLMGGIPYH